MRKKNYNFWLILTYIVLAAVCAALIIIFHQDLVSIVINVTMFVLVAIIFGFAINKFTVGWKIQKALHSATEKIKADARADSRYLWEKYKKDGTGGLFPDNILTRQYQKFTAEMLRLQQYRNVDYKCDIEDYINQEYVDAAMKKNILNLVAGTMTGLGILGTFIGLSFGLQFFNTGTAAEITDSIAPLMEGIRVAFHTSVYGMVFSLVFSFVYKASMEAVYVQLDEFLSAFNTYVMGDSYNDNESRIQEMMQEIPETIGKNLSEQMGKSLTPIVYNMNKTMMDFAQTISDSQAEGLKGLVNEFVDRLNISMGESFTRFGRMLNETVEIQNQNNIYAENIMSKLATVSGNVNDINTLSVRIMESMSGYIREIEKLQEVMTKNYSSTYRHMETLQEHEEKMQGYMYAITTHEKDVNENIKKELDEVIRMSSVFSEEIQDTSRRLSSLLDSAQTDISSAAKELSAASVGLDEKLTASLEESFRVFDSSMAEITARLGETVAQIDQTTQRVPEVVLEAVNSMQESFDGMQASLERVNNQK